MLSCFVYIGRIVDHHCLKRVIFCFVDIGRIINHHCLNFLFINDHNLLAMQHSMSDSTHHTKLEVATRAVLDPLSFISTEPYGENHLAIC